MSLITKIGGRESNSFVTLDEADDLITSEGFPDSSDEWEDLEDGQKEYRLKMAAQMMSFLPLKGDRVFCGQSLCFPRTVQNDVHSIPDEVKETQCFIAYSVIHRGLVNRPESASEGESGSRVSSVSLGGLLSVSFAGSPVTTGSALDRMIRSSQFPAYMTMSKFLTSFRGGTVKNADELTPCMTTTTTTSTTTTT